MKFWIHMGGTLDASLTLFYTNYSYTYDYDVLGRIKGPLGKDWQYYEFLIGKYPANYQVEVYAYPEYEDLDNYTDIAFDDIEFVNCAFDNFEKDKSLDCDFEKGFCDYLLDPTSDFDWDRKKSSFFGGPSQDHTTGSGYFAYTDSSYFDKLGDASRFYSSIQTSVNSNVCLKFWYHMFGEDVNRLNVYLDEHESDLLTSNFSRTLIWTKYGTQGNRWFEAQKTVSGKKAWKVTFEGVRGRTSSSVIALDDLSSSQGACAPSKVCDFEIDLCNYINDASADLMWLRGQASATTVDHTTGTQTGSFAYVEMNKGNVNSKARLVSSEFLLIGAECLQFWYLTSGLNSGLLNVYQKNSNGQNNLLWSRKSHENEEWRFGQVTIGDSMDLNNNYSFSAVFEGVKLSANNMLIGLDDISIRLGQCSSSNIYCSFEEYTICSWTQYQYDDMDWLLNQGETDSYGTGPQVDVSLGTDEGVYLYVESSYPAKKGDKALLVSDYVDAVSNGCFSLWYFMHGEDVGEFNIYTNDTGSQQLAKIKSIQGEQGFAWQQLLLNISRQNEFRLVLEGIVIAFFQLKKKKNLLN